MKEKYTKPEIEIIEFDTQDVITTSGGGEQTNPNYVNEDTNWTLFL